MIAIIGGGICGLSIGWYLVQAGQPVTIIERGEVGRGATWAAAGMLTPWASPESVEKPFFQLQLASHALWPEFVERLEAAAGMNLGYRTEGRLLISLDHENAAGLRARFEFNTGHGLTAEWLTGDEALRLEPNLSPAVTNAVFTPTGHQVDNRSVALALRRAFLQAGGALLEQTEVKEISIAGGRVSGVRLPDKALAADTVVLAAGAWSGRVPGLPATVRPPVHPAKGQMLAVQMPPQTPLVRYMISGPTSLIPRLDGRLLIGATVEEKGFDTQATAGGIFELLEQARAMLPAVDDLPIVESWAGLRPGSADGRPLLGAAAVDGLVIATGHYRHGILLTPITAQAISQLILAGQTMDVIKPFSPQRFAA